MSRLSVPTASSAPTHTTASTTTNPMISMACSKPTVETHKARLFLGSADGGSLGSMIRLPNSRSDPSFETIAVLSGVEGYSTLTNRLTFYPRGYDADAPGAFGHEIRISWDVYNTPYMIAVKVLIDSSATPQVSSYIEAMLGENGVVTLENKASALADIPRMSWEQELIRVANQAASETWRAELLKAEERWAGVSLLRWLVVQNDIAKVFRLATLAYV